ncbi:MAG: hypothetical protein ACRDZO_05655 [Egibacteraceae bacterium]
MSRVEHRTDDAEPLSPAESLALIEQTMAEARRALGISDWPFYLIWGTTWAVGFGATHWAHLGPGWPTPLGAGMTWSFAALVAVVLSVLVSVRHGRGIDGASVRIGQRIGVAWTAWTLGTPLLGLALGLRAHEIGALVVLVVAVFFMGIGAAFVDDLQLGLGVWLMATDIAGVALGQEWYSLLLAVCGGGGMLVASALAYRKELASG